MRTYPLRTSNINVPKNAFIIAETSTASEEIKTTYYASEDGSLFKVTDWKGNKPQPAYIFEVCRLTGDTVFILKGRIKSHFRK